MKCTYPIKLTKPRIGLIVITLLVFIGMAYFVGNGSWSNYLLAILASLFIISTIVSQGISERGIYHLELRVSGQIVRLSKWEEIKDIKIDSDKNKLESFKYKDKPRRPTIFPDQYYSSEAISKIKEYIGNEN